MFPATENPDVRWCQSLPAGSGLLNPAGADNIRVQVGSGPPAALLEPACPQEEKLACLNPPSHHWLTRNRTSLRIPDVGCIFGNRSIAGEFSRTSHIQNRLAGPFLWV